MISDEWRMADVISQYKGKGSKYDVGSYRSISLTSTISKVMGSIIYSNIVNHCNKFNIINTQQQDFKDKRSKCTNLLELLNDLTKNIDVGNAVDIITTIVTMYADDLTIYAVVNDFQDKENLKLELNEL